MPTATAKTIPIKSIDVPPDNRDELDPAKLQGLADTISQFGLLQRVIVRPAKKKGRFELVAGERRLRACELLKWKEIPVEEQDLDDRQAAELHAIENLQREDLTPWEEARKLAALNGAGGTRVEDLAARLGRSPQWVATRLAVSKLIPELRQLVTDQEWPLTHLPLLARVPADAQPAILEAIRETQEMDHYDGWSWFDNVKHKHIPCAPPRSVFLEFLEQYTRVLSGAPWKLDDAFLLPEAGSCDQCKKRTSAQTLLFPELQDAARKTDRCLDESCWRGKQAALVAVNVDKLKDEKPVLLKESYQNVTNEVAAAIGPATFESMHDYDTCKKTDKGARPAVIVTGDKIGEIKYVKPTKTGKPGNSGREQKRPVDQETGEPEPPPTEERLQALELKRKCRAAELWSAKLETLKQLKFTGLLDALVLHFGCEEVRQDRDDGAWEEFGARDRKIKLETTAWEQLYPIFQKRLIRNGSMEQQADAIWEECLGQARALGLISLLQFTWHDATVDCPLTKTLIDAGVKDPGPAFKEGIK